MLEEYINLLKSVLSEYYIYIILFIIPIYIIIWLFKPKVLKPDYFNKSYWEKRYFTYEKQFEWYADTNKAFEDFNIGQFLSNKHSKTNKILELGCGSSSLAYEIAQQGYKNIYAIDYSLNSIEIVKNNFGHPSISYLCADFFNLTDTFTENEIDCVVDKAGLDTINTINDTDKIKESMNIVFNQLYKVVRSNGHVIIISNKNEEFWRDVIINYLEFNKMFTLLEVKKSYFKTELSKSIGNLCNYYCLFLKKNKK